MMYAIDIEPMALSSLARLPIDVRARITARVNALVDDPRPPGVQALKGPFKGLWKLRVGS